MIEKLIVPGCDIYGACRFGKERNRKKKGEERIKRILKRRKNGKNRKRRGKEKKGEERIQSILKKRKNGKNRKRSKKFLPKGTQHRPLDKLLGNAT